MNGQGIMTVLAGWLFVLLATAGIAYMGGTLGQWATMMTRLLAAVGVLG